MLLYVVFWLRSALWLLGFGFFFFKQKTAYEMRISDWSSDVCSSDLLALAGTVVALFERRLDERILGASLGAQAALALGFFAFLLFASNPFERLNPAPLDGRGLNPLLQDPGLAFHPPTLYLGYVGLSVAFSLAVGGLIRGEVGPMIARAMRPWV